MEQQILQSFVQPAHNSVDVEEYIRDHRLAEILQEMQEKLLKDLPKEPIPYMIRFLNQCLFKIERDKKTDADTRYPNKLMEKATVTSKSKQPTKLMTGKKKERSKEFALVGKPVGLSPKQMQREPEVRSKSDGSNLTSGAERVFERPRSALGRCRKVVACFLFIY
eukprot:Colp12_sorted_trinity150504_noHs@25689